MPGWMNYKLESRLLGEILTNSDGGDTVLMAESEEELKCLLMKVKVDSEKLKAQHSEKEDHGIRSHHFIANRRENGEGSKISSSWALKSLQMATAAMKLEDDLFLAGKL